MGDVLDQAQQDGVVIGLSAPTGQNSFRQEIDELLLNDPDAFNMFLLALTALQDDSQNGDIMGFYQVAGIHGLPSQLWDGVTSNRKDRSRQWRGTGYCTHSMPTFPTWHRPYMAMYEQTLFHKMRQIAETFPEAARPKYRAAVQRFRLPYWDYYRPRAKKPTFFPGITAPNGRTQFKYDFSMPQVLTVDQIMVRQPQDDKLVQQPNPLARYQFPTTVQGGFDNVDIGNASASGINASVCTVRYPRTATDIEGDSATMNETLNSNREGGTTAILDMIEHYTDFASFATNKQTLTGTSGSLEDIHNSYHGFIGGSNNVATGWMSVVGTAAFDPVFFMHHCLIDRWCAIWQAAHPDQWFVDPNDQEEASQPTFPFRSAAGNNFWAHNDVRSTEVFGYDYQEAQGDPDQVITRFRRRHDWSVRELHPDGEFQEPPPEMEPLDLSHAQVFQYSSAGTLPTAPGPVLGDNKHQVPLQAPPSTTTKPQHSSPAQAVHQTVHQTAPQEAHHASPQPEAHAHHGIHAMVSEAAAKLGSLFTGESSTPASQGSYPTHPVTPGSNKQGTAFTPMPTGFKHAASSDIDESKYVRSWYVDDVVERLAFNGTFTIYFFIGEFDDNDVNSFSSAPTNAGSHYIFTTSRELCDNCGHQAAQGTLVTSTSVITPTLLDYIKIGRLADLTPESVVPFLIANLKWRIVTIDGQRKDPRTTPGLKIGVSSKLRPINAPPGTPPQYQEFPQIIEAIIHNGD